MYEKNEVYARSLSFPKTCLRLSILFVFATSIACENKKINHTEEGSVNVISVEEHNTVVASYVSFIANNKDRMTLDHAYTNEALLKLTSSISAIAGEVDFDIKGDLDKAKECANNITKDPFETSHADEIRKAADILSSILQNMQIAKFPGLTKEAEDVKNAAIAINPKTLMLDQRDVVKIFFFEDITPS